MNKMKTEKAICADEEAKIDCSLQKFEPIKLKEMKKVELLDRAEMKYIVSKEMLAEILKELSEDYRVLEINGSRKNNYCTLYFDTPELEMYKEHHNGLLNRYKVRMRKYLDLDLSFAEVKFKNNKKKTIKKRIPIAENLNDLDSNMEKFIHKRSPFNSENLFQVLWSYYTRITLVSKNNVERLTIDMNLEFYDRNKNKNLKLPHLAIIEIKQGNFSQRSDFIRLMHKKSIRPSRFSKYCIGVCSLYEEVKKNNFKETLLLINKLGGKARK